MVRRSASRPSRVSPVQGLLLILLTLASIGAWGTPASQGEAAPRTTRPPCAPTPVQEHAWGVEALTAFLKEHPESSDHEMKERVRRIGGRLALVSDRPYLSYTFLVVTGEGLQAYSSPGGTVSITERLVLLFEDDDHLAFAIAHELAHTALRHHVIRMCLEEALVEGGASEDDAVRESLRIVHDLQTEMEADRFGALYVVRAGFRYTATYEALERVQSAIHGPAGHRALRARARELRTFREELERARETFAAGLTALERGAPEEAIKLLNYFVAEYPSSASGWVNLGAAHLARIRADVGTPFGLSEVLPILPDPGVVVRGTLRMSDLAEARSSFERALALQPAEMMAEAGLALVDTRLERFEDARARLSRACAQDPGRADFHLNLGNVEFAADRLAEAERLYRRALDLDPDFAEARRNLALTLERASRTEEACRLWEMLATHARHGAEARRREKEHLARGTCKSIVAGLHSDGHGLDFEGLAPARPSS